ncbi:MAG: LruC domain-containing protein [Candidatus Cyclonatronum sp.]|uniref:LruC domain-containing protein n=1 Tax=Cyclonatronum sp. TaxID=3024185 RepID=UPI0025BAFBB6|nr:LruC domain-containing protein [Cyclonatronum sp.]MCH8486185.1 LruC domain-containing protein [Cyclonatronum sp.]
MKVFKIYLIVFIALLLGTACSHSISDPKDSDKDGFRSMRIPAGFTFNTTNEITINVERGGIQGDIIATILSAHPADNGRILQRAAINNGNSRQFTMSIPAHLNSVWVATKSPGELTTFQKLEIGRGGTFTVAAGAETQQRGIGDAGLASVPNGCDAGCDQILTGNISGSPLEILGNDVICLAEGATFNGSLRFQGGNASSTGEFRVCGEATITQLESWGASRPNFEIGTTGVLSSGNFAINNVQSKFDNFGTVNFSQNTLGFSYTINNYGVLNAVNLNLNSGAVLNNEGTLTVSSSMNNNSGTITNNGFFSVANTFSNNSTALTTNSCSFEVGQNFQQNAQFVNNDFLNINGPFVLNSGSGIFNEMGPGALVVAQYFTANSPLAGPSSAYARLNIANSATVNSGGNIQNLIDLCVESGNGITNFGTIASSVTFCDAFIPESSCNPGAGTAGVVDSDGDGVPDDEDAYPDDPLRAFNNYFPAANTYATVAFEDLWPGLGDYDMNDLVIDYKLNEVTNAANEVKDMIFDIRVRATGASVSSGVGVMLPVPPSAVQSVTGQEIGSGIVTLNPNGTEAGQSNAVIIFADDATRTLGRYQNTVNPDRHVPYHEFTVTITFENAVDRSVLGTSPFNIFSFRVLERGREVHLPGMPPTDLADAELFGTNDDNTNVAAGRFYKSHENLNWAIHVSESIPYPLEGVDLTNAYLNFRNWAESGGESSIDWYLDLIGNREESLLYIRNE